MYDLRNYQPEKLYGRVKQGWYTCRIHQIGIRNGLSKQGKSYQYIKVDFEISDDKEYAGVLVPAFFFYNKDQEKPDPLFGKLCWAAGLSGDYRGDSNSLFSDLTGRDVVVRVGHRYKKSGNIRIRRERAEDFEPVPDINEIDEFEFSSDEYNDVSDE